MEELTTLRRELDALARRVEQLEAELARRPAAPSQRPETPLIAELMATVARSFAKPNGFLPLVWLTSTEIASRLKLAPNQLKPLGQALRAAGFIRQSQRNGGKVEGRYPLAVRPPQV